MITDGVRWRSVARTEDAGVDADRPHGARQADHLTLHASGQRQAVRADQGDAHLQTVVPPLATARDLDRRVGPGRGSSGSAGGRSASRTVAVDSDGDAFPPLFFARQDPSPDSEFYSWPRLVTHIDDDAIAAVGALYDELGIDGAVLDLMGSWISHFVRPPARLTVLGMNPEELAANRQAAATVLHDLNADPVLPFPAGSFDAAVCCVSVDYLIRPVEVFAEVARVLRAGGPFVVTFSNRCFPTKAIAASLHSTDEGHAALVVDYFRRSGGSDEPWRAAHTVRSTGRPALRRLGPPALTRRSERPPVAPVRAVHPATAGPVGLGWRAAVTNRWPALRGGGTQKERAVAESQAGTAFAHRSQPGHRQGHRRLPGQGGVRRGHHGPDGAARRWQGALLHHPQVGHLPAPRQPGRDRSAGGEGRPPGPDAAGRPARPGHPGRRRHDRDRTLGPRRRARQQRALRRPGAHGPLHGHPGGHHRQAPRGQRAGPAPPHQAHGAGHAAPRGRPDRQPHVHLRSGRPAGPRRRRAAGASGTAPPRVPSTGSPACCSWSCRATGSPSSTWTRATS